MTSKVAKAKWLLICIVSLNLLFPLNGQIELKYQENKTPTWSEVIDLYSELDKDYTNVRLIEAGTTDAGKPLHLFIISSDQVFTPEEVHDADKRIIMINNGIHPGESNGIDASLDFASDLLSGELQIESCLDNTVILIIPIFNVGGALNRSPYNRANQNGPEEHGFRGNSRNLDLNRDFVKMDSRNALSLSKIIHEWNPDVFIDTHSTNGADYPYTVTIIPSHFQQLEKPLSGFSEEVMVPYLFDKMNASPYKMSHYVNVFRSSPEQGFEGFFEYPRYLAGHTSYFQILSFTVETHMLKPYAERVLSTKYILGEFLKFTSSHSEEIKNNRDQAISATMQKEEHVLLWENDSSSIDSIVFSGYKAKQRTSELTGLNMLYYDKDDPWIAEIPYYNTFKAVHTVMAPDYYIIPFAWQEVIARLKTCRVEMKQLTRDTTLSLEAYFITDFQTTKTPYNGHYWHFNTDIESRLIRADLHEGDYIIPVSQRAAAFIVHTLEPQAYDSFFSWNFFDATLSRNEYFSPYLFEETAKKYLEDNPRIKKEFLDKKANEPAFSRNSYAQLNWIYEHSPWSEPSYRRYPVYRYNGDLNQ